MRARFAAGQGGTLRHKPSEDGVATSATVTIRRAADAAKMPTEVEAAAATVAAQTGELSFVLVTANTPDPLTKGNLYRAVWTYTISGVTYQADQLFEVNQRLLKPVVRSGDVLPYLPADWADLLAGGEAAADQAVENAWEDMLDDVVGRGFRADLIVDAERLRQAHRAKVIALLYGSFGPQWIEAAREARAEYQRELDAVLAAPGWYDLNNDAKGTDAETQIGCIRLTR